MRSFLGSPLREFPPPFLGIEEPPARMREVALVRAVRANGLDIVCCDWKERREDVGKERRVQEYKAQVGRGCFGWLLVGMEMAVLQCSSPRGVVYSQIRLRVS